MSHHFCKYECPDCGYTIDELSWGGRLWSEDEEWYVQFQCPKCKKVESINVPIGKDNADDFPLCNCCNVKMQEWKRTCPMCGNKMKETEFLSEIC